MSTPPRIRGLIDRVAHEAQMVCYAKGPEKSAAKAKVEALRAFAVVAGPAPIRHVPRRRPSGDYECPCGAVWDADEGSDCPNL